MHKIVVQFGMYNKGFFTFSVLKFLLYRPMSSINEIKLLACDHVNDIHYNEVKKRQYFCVCGKAISNSTKKVVH